MLGLVGELPDLWDFMVGDWDFDSNTSRFAEEGVPGAVRPAASSAHDQAGGRRRPVHVARHDGADGARRRARHDRRGPAVDRRPVPAQEDRGGPLATTSASASAATSASPATSTRPAPLHPEPDHGRGVAARLASRADPAQDRRRDACWSSAPARPGSRPRRRSGKRGYDVVLAEAGQRARRPRRARRRACPAWRRGSGSLDYRKQPARAADQRRARIRQRADAPTRCSSTASTTSRSRPAHAGATTASAAGTSARSRSSRACRC